MLHLILACSSSTPPVAPPPPEAPAVAAKAPAPALPLPPPASGPEPGVRRLVAIGDLHGDLDAAKQVLHLAGLTDEEHHWNAGDTVFVQTGDLVDRGPDSKGVVDLLRRLQQEAPASGGTVHLLNGNHEVMNLQGDWRYVSPADLNGFGGKLERMSAMSATGEYGSFFATLPLTVQVDGTVFAHGGVHDSFAVDGLDAINARARAHYWDAPGPDGDAVHGELGPTWYRGYVREPEATACPRLMRALDALGATRMVVGHTTQRQGVLSRCGGRLAVVDTGISAHYGGVMEAWEARDGDARVLSVSGVRDLVDP